MNIFKLIILYILEFFFNNRDKYPNTSTVKLNLSENRLDVFRENKEELWRDYNIHFNKKNSTELQRRKIFFQRILKFREHNRRFHLGLFLYYTVFNKFSDMSKEERMRYTGVIPKTMSFIKRVKRGLSSSEYSFDQNDPPFYKYSADDSIELPSGIDHRVNGWTEPVRDQGICGSCWAFSVSSVFSFSIFNRTNKNVVLSPQNLVDCSSVFGNIGCDGGWPPGAFEYIAVYKLNTEESYPYTSGTDGKTHACQRKSLNSAPLYGIDTFVIINKDEGSVKQAVAMLGPLVVSINADYLFDYGGGIWDGVDPESGALCNTTVNHAVTLVGYGKNSTINQNYWIIKNSWGSTWGENGYFRMKMSGSSLCGIYSMVTGLN